jgi:hypothetical protein
MATSVLQTTELEQPVSGGARGVGFGVIKGGGRGKLWHQRVNGGCTATGVCNADVAITILL